MAIVTTDGSLGAERTGKNEDGYISISIVPLSPGGTGVCKYFLRYVKKEITPIKSGICTGAVLRSDAVNTEKERVVAEGEHEGHAHEGHEDVVGAGVEVRGGVGGEEAFATGVEDGEAEEVEDGEGEIGDEGGDDAVEAGDGSAEKEAGDDAACETGKGPFGAPRNEEIFFLQDKGITDQGDASRPRLRYAGGRQQAA